MPPKLSVILCTHNPRRDYLERTFEGLKRQTLPKDQWEFLLIDNLSEPPLEQCCDLSWHPVARVVWEEELGILPARVRGFRETSADLILFLDDDNVLSPNYFEEALQIGMHYPFLGAWGAGRIELEYESPPPVWIKEFEYLFTPLDLNEERWAKMGLGNPVMPPTMGMCLRRVVAEKFLDIVESDPRRKLLGRRGKKQFFNCEDNDLALSACDLGLSTGQFPQLAFRHLIPARRLDLNYLLALYEGTYCSYYVLAALRGSPQTPLVSNTLRNLLGKIRRRFFMPNLEREKLERYYKAQNEAYKIINAWQRIA
jgi:glycosyltransferase involved in cell wall biosynthesis